MIVCEWENVLFGYYSRISFAHPALTPPKSKIMLLSTTTSGNYQTEYPHANWNQDMELERLAGPKVLTQACGKTILVLTIPGSERKRKSSQKKVWSFTGKTWKNTITWNIYKTIQFFIFSVGQHRRSCAIELSSPTTEQGESFKEKEPNFFQSFIRS